MSTQAKKASGRDPGFLLSLKPSRGFNGEVATIAGKAHNGSYYC